MTGQAEQAEDPFIGAEIQGRYRVLKKLGEGGMGAVYLGEHLMIRKKVAIKVLHGQFAKNDDVVQRFHREALAATSIGNEHIVEVTDMDHLEDGSLFMVLEFLEGRDFSDDIDNGGAQPIGRVVRIVMQVCEALGAAHDKGIVHRDLKPENLFLIERGGKPDFVKVLDFGISKFRTTVDGGTGRMTATGTALGTPYFMSPEQAESSADVDLRTDIYAIGCILYNALTGQFPFDAESYPALILAICTREPRPLQELRPDVPEALAGVVHRALAKRRDDRFGSCFELRKALEAFKGLDAPPELSEGATVDKAAALFTTSGIDTLGATRTPDASTDPTGFLATAASQPGAPGAAAGAADASAGPTHASSGIRSSTHPPAKEASPLPQVLGGVAVVGAIAAAFVLGGGNSAPAAPEAPAPAPAVAPAPPVASPNIKVTIRTAPQGAALYIDGSRIANPYDGELPKSAVPRQLEARLEGHETVTQPLVLQYPQKVLLELKPRVQAAEQAAERAADDSKDADAAARRGAKRKQRRQRAQADATAAAPKPAPSATPEPPAAVPKPAAIAPKPVPKPAQAPEATDKSRKLKKLF